MRMKKLMLMSVATMLLIGMASNAWALSQWSRKYNVSCKTCHTAFPRLNAYGDAFAQNGYQLPGSEDGDEEKKKKIEGVNIGQVEDFFGVRMSFTQSVTNPIRSRKLMVPSRTPLMSARLTGYSCLSAARS